MTKEKRMECLEWLVDLADFQKSILSMKTLELSDTITVNRIDAYTEVHLYGDGFYELARAASQTVKTTAYSERHDKEYFLFDGVEFFRLIEKEVRQDDAES